MTIQILLMRVDFEKKKSSGSASGAKDSILEADIKSFSLQKSRVVKGAKEARWNNKYMKIIEKPVQ